MLATQCILQPFTIENTSSGCECFFIECEDFGIKLYKDEDEANRVANRQRTASKYGLGPKVLSEVIAYDIPDKLSELIARERPNLSGSVLYGYETEIVEIRSGVLQSMLDELIGKFADRLGQDLWDLAGPNVGFKKNGEMVCIDFGDCSFENDF